MPESIDSYQRLIQRARAANTLAVNTLTSVMMDWSSERPAQWKGIDQGNPKATYCPLASLREMEDHCWAPLVMESIRFAEQLFPGTEVLLAMLSLEEKSKISDGSLGLDCSIALHSCSTVRDLQVDYSFTRHFLRLRQDLESQRSTNRRQNLARRRLPVKGGIGICVTEKSLHPGSEGAKETHFVHIENDTFVPSRAGDEYVDAIDEVNSRFNGSQKWTRYVGSYQPLVRPGARIGGMISATSIYKAVEAYPFDEARGKKQAAVQLALGLSAPPPDASKVVLLHELLQLLQMGIPPLYSALTVSAREVRRLRTQDQRMRLIEKPLAGLSRALATMQAETQELSAVIYEPARSLFQSHRQLVDLFTEKSVCEPADKVKIRIEHRMVYPGKRGHAIVAVALCRIFGLAERLRPAKDVEDLLKRARKILTDVQKSPDQSESFAEITAQLVWLCDLAPKGPTPGAVFQATPMLKMALTMPPQAVLLRLKTALFDPYKIYAETWPLLPFILAARSFQGPNVNRDDYPDESATLDLTGHPNPTVCQHVIELLMGVAASIVEKHPVAGLSIANSQLTEIRMEFSCELVTEEDGAARLARQIRRFVLSSPREWRIEHELAGNWRKPFIDFATRLLGVGNDSSDTWKPVHAKQDEPWIFPIITLSHRKKAATFGVLIEQPQAGKSALVLQWRNTSGQVAVTGLGNAVGSAQDTVPVNPMYGVLLDHLQREDRSQWHWLKTLNRHELVVHGNAFPDLTPEEFLSDPVRAQCPIVYLHARDSDLRPEWNRMVREDKGERFKGHLVHISRGEPTKMGGHLQEPHPRIHACLFGCGGNALAPFALSVKEGRPKWELLNRIGPVPLSAEVAVKSSVSKPILVLALDESFRARAHELGAVYLVGDNYAALSAWRDDLATIVLVHPADEALESLILRHAQVRAWLKKNWIGRIDHPKVRFILFTTRVAEVKAAALAESNGVKLTFATLEAHSHRICDAARGFSEVVKLCLATIEEWPAKALNELERQISADQLRDAVFYLRGLLAAESLEMTALVHRTIVLLVDRMSGADRYRVEAFFRAPEHPNAKQFINLLRALHGATPGVTSADTLGFMKDLRLHLNNQLLDGGERPRS